MNLYLYLTFSINYLLKGRKCGHLMTIGQSPYLELRITNTNLIKPVRKILGIASLQQILKHPLGFHNP